MSLLLERYAEVAGRGVIDQIEALARPLRGLEVVHVNSTRSGGGVAEILAWMVPLLNELGLSARWEVVNGDGDYFECTKSFHNGLQGYPVALSSSLLRAYEQTNEANAERLRQGLRKADLVVVHDPQPAPLLGLIPERRGTWIWRCHIDASRPNRAVWKYLRRHVAGYDASIFSLPDFTQRLPHRQFLIPPSIDPLSEKNIELGADEIESVRSRFNLDPDRPLVTQISRFDRFKDPVGVVQAYRRAKRGVPGLQLVLAGGEATDDPEGARVYREVQEAAGDDPDVRLLLLPSDAHRAINALQRVSDVVIQKSTREGFGLTVAEALWKFRPVIGGNTGGIRLQVVDYQTGFLVDTPEGASERIRYLLSRPRLREEMGARAHAFVRESFLLTRHLVEYLALFNVMIRGESDRIEVA